MYAATSNTCTYLKVHLPIIIKVSSYYCCSKIFTSLIINTEINTSW